MERGRTSGSRSSSVANLLPARLRLLSWNSAASCKASSPSEMLLSLSSRRRSSGRVGNPSSVVRPHPFRVSDLRLLNFSRPLTFVALHVSSTSSVTSLGGVSFVCAAMAASRSMGCTAAPAQHARGVD